MSAPAPATAAHPSQHRPASAAIALEAGVVQATEHMPIPCRGGMQWGNRYFRCWKPEGHGEVDIHDALAQSCDVFFYEISGDIGIDRMHDYLTRFGLGSTTGVDVAGERPGLVPSTEWKRNAFRNPSDKRWFLGETVIASIGQGYMLATPLQLATATAALATRGVRYEPRIVAAWEDPLSGERTLASPVRLDDVELDDEGRLPQDQIDKLQQAMSTTVGNGLQLEAPPGAGSLQIRQVGVFQRDRAFEVVDQALETLDLHLIGFEHLGPVRRRNQGLYERRPDHR